MSPLAALLALAALVVAADAGKQHTMDHEIEKKLKMDDRPIFFTSSRHIKNTRELHSPGVAKAVPLNSPGVAKKVPLSLTKKIVRAAAHAPGQMVSKPETSDADTNENEETEVSINRGRRGKVVNAIIAHMQSKTDNSSYGKPMSINRDTFSLLVTDELINNMRVMLPKVMPNFKNPTWVETHAEVPADKVKNSFYHICDPKNRKKRTIEMSPAAKNFLDSVLRQRKLGKDANSVGGNSHNDSSGGADIDTDPHQYDTNRRAACAPDFMIVGAAGIGAQDVANMLEYHHRHLAPVYFEYNYWDIRECTEKIQCGQLPGQTVPPPTFGEYKSLHQDACEKIRRNSYFLKQRDTEYHAMTCGTVINSLLNWNPCWKSLPGNEHRLAPLVTTATLVQAMLPALKVIVMMRDPVKKALGLYRQMYRVEKANADLDPIHFNETMSAEVAAWNDCRVKENMTNTQCVYFFMAQPKPKVQVLTQCLYHVFVEDYLNVFGKNKTRFLRFEDFKSEHVTKLEEIGEFLGVPPMAPKEEHRIEAVVHNRTTMSVSMNEDTRDMLKEFFKPHNERLFELTKGVINWT